VTVLLLLAATGCAFWSWRTVPVAAALLVPVAAPAIQERIGRGSAPPGRRELVALGTGCVVSLTALALTVPHRVSDPTRNPAWLQPALSSLPPGTEVLSTWDTSAILMWRFPQLDVIAHGYGDTYTVPELQRSVDIQNQTGDWVGDLRRTRCTIAVLGADTDLASALTGQEHWQVVHRSDGLEMIKAPAGWAVG
jgi:hypothetical protein